MERLTERQFLDWMQFFREEPFGPEATNLMLARVASAACQGAAPPADFLISFDGAEE